MLQELLAELPYCCRQLLTILSKVADSISQPLQTADDSTQMLRTLNSIAQLMLTVADNISHQVPTSYSIESTSQLLHVAVARIS